MPGKKQRKRERAADRQNNFCFLCWKPMLPAGAELDDSACLLSLDPPGAPWPTFMQGHRHVAVHVRCAGDFNDLRQPGKSFSVAAQ